MHFGVLVKIKDPADLDDVMAPFDENLEMDPVMVLSRADHIQQYKDRAVSQMKQYADYYKDRDKFEADMKAENKIWIVEMLDKNRNEEVLNSMTDDEIFNLICELEGYTPGEDDMDKDGNLWSSYNPDSHWDWWVIGGRWGNSLISKDLAEINEGRCDYCKFKDLDLAKMMEVTPRELAVAEARWDNAVEGVPIPEEFKDDIFGSYRKEYYLNRYGTKENYLQSLATVSFYACIDEDGVWHEQEHSKLDVSSDEYYAEDDRLEEEWHDNFVRDYLLGTDPETYVVVVDCHS